MTAEISRRGFLKVSGFSVAVLLTSKGCRQAVVRKGQLDVDTDAYPAIAWIRITPDNHVTVIVGRSELGQGVHTSLPMIIADELEADWNRVKVEMAPAGKEFWDPVYQEQSTISSSSVRHMWTDLREAGAAMRELLVRAAARRWQVPREQCRAEMQRVIHAASGRSATYGELCLAAAELPLPSKSDLSLKDPSQFRYIGTSKPRIDIPGKLAGTAQYGMDVFLDGMLYALVARPPAFGATFATAIGAYDEKAARAVPGVRDVVRLPGDRVAVCAETPSAAFAGKKALAPRWTGGSHPDLDNDALDKVLDDALQKDGITVLDEGDGALSPGLEVSGRFVTPYLHHATIEPPTCLVRVAADRCDIWAPTQIQSRNVNAAAKITGLPADKIHIHTTYLGGGFGRKSYGDFVDEGVLIAKKTGQPIKLLWTREDDIRHGIYLSSSTAMAKAHYKSGVGITSWKHKVVCDPIKWEDGGTDVHATVEGVINKGRSRTYARSHFLYNVSHLNVSYVHTDRPVPVGYLRSVGFFHNVFAVETTIDALAFAARKDPLQFRLDHLNRKQHPRALALLNRVAEMSGWTKKTPENRGMGLAHYYFDRFPGSYLAQVAEVSVDIQTGVIRVHRVFCAADCGTVVHPGQVVAQVEGGTIMGLSMALKERLLVEAGGVKASNYHDYPILRMDEAPEITVHVMDSREPPGGIGDASPPLIGPAVANAVFDVVRRQTGKQVRLRRLPLTPPTVVQTLRKAPGS
ncbi:MAG: xanthine dehydrogenase family protein molybdopterin-binding subunit [Proteobacteria bacterium]|nr:xanthine dehydrogenase family protein molybdopterin-binding subunit [Pseudomonadota bacterium]